VTFLTSWLHELWLILLESGVWLLGGFLLAGVVHVLMPRELIARWMGGRGLGSIVRAAVVGVPLPLCSCSVIPVAAGLRRDGAGKGASAAFAVSTPESGVDSIAFTWAVLGPVMGITRPLAALVSALAAGTLVSAVEKDETQTDPDGARDVALEQSCCGAHTPKAEPVKSDAGCCGGGAPAGRAVQGVAARATEALRYGWLEMPKDLAGWLVVGLALSALISAVTPENWLGEHIGSGLGPMLLMLVAGMPVYVCATASTPVAAALVAKGLSPGAALVFLLAGPATNMATMAWVAKDLGWRALGAYLAAIGVCSVAFGVALDALIKRGAFGGMTESFAQMTAAHEHGASAVEIGFGVSLAVVLGLGLARAVGGKLVSTSHDDAHACH